MLADPQACDDARRTWWLETAPGSRFVVDTTPMRMPDTGKKRPAGARRAVSERSVP